VAGAKLKDDDYGRYPRSGKKKGDRPIENVLKDLTKPKFPGGDYRERSLKIHGLICAKCGREFDYTNRNLLTVHHKDGNPRNNPPDGSNWENLCVYCHDDEHSRDLLGSYLTGDEESQ
jgi:hypothetical protein